MLPGHTPWVGGARRRARRPFLKAVVGEGKGSGGPHVFPSPRPS